MFDTYFLSCIKIKSKRTKNPNKSSETPELPEDKVGSIFWHWGIDIDF